MEYYCIECGREVRPRQHAVACDDCDRWQHRICGTGISQKNYRAAVHGRKELSFVCRDCTTKTTISLPEPSDDPPHTATQAPLLETATSSTTETSVTHVSPSSTVTETIQPETQSTIPQQCAPVLETVPPEITPEEVSTIHQQCAPVTKTVPPETTSEELPTIHQQCAPVLETVPPETTSEDLSPIHRLRAPTQPEISSDEPPPVIRARTSVRDPETVQPGTPYETSSIPPCYPVQDTESTTREMTSPMHQTFQTTAKLDPLVTHTLLMEGSSVVNEFVRQTGDTREISHHCAVRNDTFRTVRYDRSFFSDTSMDMSDLSDQEEHVPLTYKLIENGSRRGKHLLTDSHGYTYCVKNTTRHTIHWRCSIRTKFWTCRANVSQRGTNFEAGTNTHNHLPHIQRSKDAELYVKIRERVQSQPASSTQTARSIVKETIGDAASPVSDVRMSRLIRMTNRVRAKQTKITQYTTQSTGHTTQVHIPADSERSDSRHQQRPLTGHPSPITSHSQTARMDTVQIQPVVHSQPNKQTMVQDEDITNVHDTQKQLKTTPTLTSLRQSRRHPYARTARSIVEDSIRQSGLDLSNLPPGINIENLIRVVNRTRRQQYLKELARMGDDASQLKPRVLQPPRQTPVQVDTDCLQGKEEDRMY